MNHNAMIIIMDGLLSLLNFSTIESIAHGISLYIHTNIHIMLSYYCMYAGIKGNLMEK